MGMAPAGAPEGMASGAVGVFMAERGAWTSAAAPATRPAPARIGAHFLEGAVGQQALDALLHELLGRHALQLAQGVAQRAAQQAGHDAGVAVRAAHGFVDDAIDQAQVLQARGDDCQRLGGLGRLSALRHRMDAQPSGEITA